MSINQVMHFINNIPIFVLLIFYHTHLAFGQASNYLFDSNCEPFARDKKNLLVKGTLEKDKSTERYFNWDKITPTYSNYINIVFDLKNKYSHLSVPQIALKENQPNLTQTESFKSYCIDLIAKVGMEEELKKWTTHAKNCLTPWYLQKYPEHCTKDNVASLNYLASHAKKLATLEGKKSPQVRKFFNEANQFFSKFSNDLAKLIEAQDLLRKIEESKNREALKIGEVKDTFDKCQTLVDDDNNDINGRNLADKILYTLGSCTNGEAPKTTLDQLANDMKKINEKILQQDLIEDLNTTSLEKSLQAYWLMNLQTNGLSHDWNKFDLNKKRLILKSKTCSEVPKVCQNDITIEKIINDFLDSKIDKNVIKLSDDQIQSVIKNDFNERALKINNICTEAHAKVKEVHRQYNCYQAKSIQECDGLLDQFTWRKNEIVRDSNKKMESLYSQIVQSTFAPLLLTKDFKDKVGHLQRGQCFSHERPIDFPMKTINVADFKKGQTDYLDLIKEELSGLQKKMTESRDTEKQIKNYLKTHPQTVSELLKNNPNKDYALLLCRYVREINNTDQKRQWVHYGAAGVGIAASAALAMTGVGAPVAPVLMSLIVGATVADVGTGYMEYRDAKKEASDVLLAGATNQYNFDLAIRDHEKWNDQSRSSLENIVIILAAEVGTLGAGKILSMIGKMKNSRLIKFLTKSSGVVDDLNPETLAKIQKGVEKFQTMAQNKGIPKNLLSSLSPEQVMELGALFSKIDDEAANLIFKEMKNMSPNQWSRFMDDLAHDPERFFISGTVNKKYLNERLVLSKEERLPGGQLLSDFQNQIELLAGKISPNSSKYSSQLYDDFAPLNQRLGKNSSNNLIKYLDSLDPKDRKKFLNALAKDKNKTIETLGDLTCLHKPLHSNCQKDIEAILKGLPGDVGLQIDRLQNKIGKLDQALSKTLKENDFSQYEIDFIYSKLPDIKLSAFDQKRLAEYMDFLSTQPIDQRLNSIKAIDKFIQGERIGDPLYLTFQKLSKNGDDLKIKWKQEEMANIKSKNPHLSPDEQLRLADEFADVKKQKWMHRSAACRSPISSSYHSEGFERFSTFNKIAGPIFTTISYLMTNIEKDKDEMWFKKLGWELMLSMIFSRVPGLIMKGNLTSGSTRIMQENLVSVVVNTPEAKLYAHLFGDSKDQELSNIDQKMKDPEFLLSLKKFDNKLSELLTTPEYDQLLGKYQEELVALNDLTYEQEFDFTNLDMEDYLQDDDLKKITIEASAENDPYVTTGNTSYDRLLFKSAFNLSTGPKRLLVYKALQKQLCLGNYTTAISIFTADRLIFGRLHYESRNFLIDQ